MIHIVQDLVINRAHVGRTSYAFRKTLGAADREITIVNLEGKKELVKVGDYVWRIPTISSSPATCLCPRWAARC